MCCRPAVHFCFRIVCERISATAHVCATAVANALPKLSMCAPNVRPLVPCIQGACPLCKHMPIYFMTLICPSTCFLSLELLGLAAAAQLSPFCRCFSNVKRCHHLQGNSTRRGQLSVAGAVAIPGSRPAPPAGAGRSALFPFSLLLLLFFFLLLLWNGKIFGS